jgi:hypothetical protein
MMAPPTANLAPPTYWADSFSDENPWKYQIDSESDQNRYKNNQTSNLLSQQRSNSS